MSILRKTHITKTTLKPDTLLFSTLKISLYIDTTFAGEIKVLLNCCTHFLLALLPLSEGLPCREAMASTALVTASSVQLKELEEPRALMSTEKRNTLIIFIFKKTQNVYYHGLVDFH